MRGGVYDNKKKYKNIFTHPCKTLILMENISETGKVEMYF